MSESDFLKIRESTDFKNTDNLNQFKKGRINIEMPEEMPNGLTSQIKPYNSIEMKNSGITIVSNCFYCSNKLYT